MELPFNPGFLWFAVPAVLITGISKGGFAGGLGLIAVPLMALAVPPTQAAAIMLPILCVMDLFGVWAYRYRWHARNTRILVSGALLGIVTGALVFKHISQDGIRLLLGIMALFFVLRYWLGGRAARTAPVHTWKGLAYGALSGFTSTTAHAGGPPVSMYLLPQGLDKTTFQATTVIFFLVINYIKLIPYSMLGQFSPENLSMSLVMLPVAWVGIRLGIRWHDRVDDSWFRGFCYVALFVAALKLLYDGLQ